MSAWTKILYIAVGVIAGVLIIKGIREPAPLDPAVLWDTLSDAGGLTVDPDLEDALMEERLIVINTDINARTARDLVARLLILERTKPGEPITLYLRTEGGWEADAFSIVDVMQFLRSPVHVIGMGEVHSAGIMILTAGTGNRTLLPSTVLGFHAPGPDDQDPYLNRYLDFFKTNSSLPEEWLSLRDDEMRYFTAKKAVEYGLADRIAVSLDRSSAVPAVKNRSSASPPRASGVPRRKTIIRQTPPRDNKPPP